MNKNGFFFFSPIDSTVHRETRRKRLRIARHRVAVYNTMIYDSDCAGRIVRVEIRNRLDLPIWSRTPLVFFCRLN